MSYAVAMRQVVQARSVDDGTTTPQEAEALARQLYESGQKLQANGALLTDAVVLAMASIQQAIDHAVAGVRDAMAAISQHNDEHKALYEKVENHFYQWEEPSQAFLDAYEQAVVDVDDDVYGAQEFLDEYGG